MKEVQPMAAVNGVVTRLEEARIPVMDRGFLYGDATPTKSARTHFSHFTINYTIFGHLCQEL